MGKLFGLFFSLVTVIVIGFTVSKDALIDVAHAKRSITSQMSPVTTPPPITSISVCSPNNPGTLQQGSCRRPETFDTHQIVLGPAGQSVNSSLATLGGGIGVVPDEHSTVYAPGTLGANPDYLFFLSTGLGGNAHLGVSVLSGGSGPQNGQWTLKFPKADGYGAYDSGFGPVFNPSTKGSQCPAAPNNDARQQDQTFDMHYASAGSIVKDPTAAPGSMLMVYEGTNACIGNSGGEIFGNNDDYISLGIATSLDYGKDWPTYRANPFFDYYPLPDVNPSQAPNNPQLVSTNPMGAWGSNVCAGNCPPAGTSSPAPPDSYGRYAVVTPTTSLASLMIAPSPSPLTSKYGEQEISGFVDDVSTDATRYLYVNWGSAKIARAALNGGTARLSFDKLSGTDFVPHSGIGGDESNSSLLPTTGDFVHCGDAKQNQFGSSISYVEQTHQYLLTFVCVSTGDPQLGMDQANPARGAAWFWLTTSSLSPPMKWGPTDANGNIQPQEIDGSWSDIDFIPPPTPSPGASPDPPCPSYKGYYPSFMSLDKSAGHLSLDGYVFYLWGCQGGGSERQMSACAFKITTTDTTPPVTTAAVAGPLGLNGWYTGPTTVSFTAQDDLSGVAITEYSVDGGSWTTGNSVALSADAIHQVLYHSIDVDENAETPKSITVMLDATHPTITATPDASLILNLKRVAEVAISGRIKDNLSGIDPATARFVVHDEYGKVEPTGPITIAPDGSYSFRIPVLTFVRPKDTDGRLYRIRVTAADNAGNSRTTETSITVKRLPEPPPRHCGKHCV